MDEELEETIKYLKAMRVIDFDKLGFVYAKETIDEVLNLIKQQQSELERKEYLYNKALSDVVEEEKIIDEMAQSIANNNDIEYEVCEDVREEFDECDCYARKTHQSCEDCIKNYFKKKVSEEKTKHS